MLFVSNAQNARQLTTTATVYQLERKWWPCGLAVAFYRRWHNYDTAGFGGFCFLPKYAWWRKDLVDHRGRKHPLGTADGGRWARWKAAVDASQSQEDSL